MKPVIPITYQPNLVQPIPEVLDHKDYNEYRKLLERIDEILTISKLDLDFAGDYLELKTKNRKRPLSSKSRCRIIEEGVIIFRCNLIKIMTGASFRELSILVADSFLIRHFARLSSLSNHLKAPSKSLLHRYSKYFTKEMVDSKIHTLLASAGSIKNPLRLEKPLEVDDIFVDSTCIKANIHFPVDWLLVKDCAYTLIQSIAVIRKHGLKYRIKEPKQFLFELNALCMSMSSATKNRRNIKKKKSVFRELLTLVKVISSHGETYMNLLLTQGLDRTNLSENEIQFIVSRMDKMLTLLPYAIEQARSRILKNEPLKNSDKILSAYHDNINVIKRGKAGGIVEFGNTLFIAEQRNGVIVDWKLYKENVKDPQATKESINRITEELELEMRSYTGDRGCQSKSNDKLLAKKGIYSGLCPRSPHDYNEKLKDKKFKKLQKRRAQTEGRIGILKNTILDGSLYEREFDGKDLKISWAILFHNLWVLARLPQLNENLEQIAA